MKKRFSILFLSVSFVLCAIGTLSSCKDNDDDMYSELRGDQATLKEAIQDQIDALNDQLKNIKSCNCDPTQFVKKSEFDESFATAMANYKVGDQTLTVVVANVQSSIAKAQKALAANNVSIDSLAKVTNNLNLTIIDAKNLAQNAYDLANKANNLAVGDSVRIDGLQTAIKDLNTRVIGMGDSLRTAYDNASYAKAKADANANWIDAFKKVYASKTDSIDKVTKNLQDSINAVRTLANANYALAMKYTDDAVNIATKNLTDTINTKVSDLKKGYEAADKELQKQITELNTKVANLDAKIDATAKALNERFSDALSKLVTGIIVQGVENPVFGSFALPVGVRSNVLMTYYGQNNQSERYFPSSETHTEAAYDADNAFSEYDLNFLKTNCGTTPEFIPNGQKFLSSSDGNAGTVYMTVNPAGTNFENLKVTLVNSQDKESGIKIGELKKSDKLLTFGYTRSADNGFYEAPATLDEANLNSVKINVEPGLKSSLAEVLKNKGQNIDYKSLLYKVYQQFDGILDANALKASWKDSLGQHSVYSQYNVAATALQPLSFTFLEGTTLPKIPTINPLTELDNFDVRKYFTDSLKFNFPKPDPLTITLPTYTISIALGDVSLAFDFSKLDLTQGSSQSIPVSGNVTVYIPNTDNATVDANGKVIGIVPVPTTIPFNTTVSLGGFLSDLNISLKKQLSDQLSTSINGELNKQIATWNKTLSDSLNSQINTMMTNITTKLQNQVNDMVSQMFNSINTTLNDKVEGILDQINSAVRNNAGAYIGKLNNYITRINSFANRINTYLANANDYMQVTMLYVGNDGNYHQLSNTKAIPTVFKVGTGDATTLLPTTYTAEIVAPAYKKFIAVTNVFMGSKSAQGGDATCRAALIAANDQNYVNKIVDGGRLAIPFVARATDAVYEITYSALDYNGTSSTRKFYVKVVK